MFIPRRSMAESIVALMSRGSMVPEAKKPNYLNTYKLYPDNKPNIGKIERVIKKIVEGTVYKYSISSMSHSH